MNRNIQRQFLFTLIPSILVLILAILINQIYDVRIISMTKDVTRLGEINPFSGFISSLGIVLWASTASICLFTSCLLKKQKKKPKFRFFFSIALISMYLLFDDLFLLHEQSGSVLFGGEKMVYTILAITMLIFLISFKNILLESNYFMFLLSIIFLFSSIVIDTIQPWFWEKGDFHALMEDGTKWLGIVCWSSYFLDTAFNSISSSIYKNITIKNEFN